MSIFCNSSNVHLIFTCTFVCPFYKEHRFNDVDFIYCFNLNIIRRNVISAMVMCNVHRKKTYGYRIRTAKVILLIMFYRQLYHLAGAKRGLYSPAVTDR